MSYFYLAIESKEAQENIPETIMIKILMSELQEVHREKNWEDVLDPTQRFQLGEEDKRLIGRFSSRNIIIWRTPLQIT